MLRHLTREPALAVGLTLAVIPPALLHFLAHDKVAWGGVAHMLFVSASAGMATAAAIALTYAAARRGDGRSVMIGTAFAVMAALLVLHGLATPNVLFHDYGIVALSGGATLPVGGFLLALCTLSMLRGPKAVRPLLALQGLLLAGVATLGAIGLAFPNTVPPVPAARSGVAIAALVLGLSLYTLVGWRAFRTFRLTRRAADVLVVVGTVWLVAALGAATLLDYTELGWWMGHALEVLGIASIGLPVAVDLRRQTQSRPLVGDLTACELVAQEEAFLGSQVSALTRVLALRDTYTEEHTRRVALRAVQVGEELGLPPEASARPRSRWAAARHGQALGSGRHPEEARLADRGGVRADQAPLRVGRRAAREARLPVAGPAARARPPRAGRRLRLSVRRMRRAARSRDPHHRRL